MPVFEETNCPFCGADVEEGDSACPSCDLPLLAADGSHPPTRDRRAPFDGAGLFGEPRFSGQPASASLATERRDEPLRCLVVAANQAEAEMLCSMLRGEGIPCMMRPPDLQSYAQAGARCELLVPESSLPLARELLRIEAPTAVSTVQRPVLYLISLVLIVAVIAAAAALAVTQLI
jgi:hypothetical protein